ncbi:laminin subunit beta-3 isoform X2 [Halichoeres trimaculatus]|uniref:laminin subunit beta-3 isoform X2 n=1 Tax=Halichoeres trimaculatus TaxID=147232 RepID=UPI003D9E5C25
MRIFLLLAAIAAVSQAQSDCSRGACYPPTNDLLLGRANRLHTTSTCGLSGSEVFCTPYEERRMKCCPCDSRDPDGPLAHTLQEVLSTASPDRWWQSKKEVEPVTLQFDLDNMYQLDNLVLTFKGPRPSAFVIEKTLDKGKTWQPALHLATDCRRSFPGIPTASPVDLDHTYCYTLPSTDEEPYRDHTIQFSPLRQYAYVPVPNHEKIEGVSGITGLRVKLLEFGEVPQIPGRTLSKFYALRDMRVIGSCMCHGHANRCLPETSTYPQYTGIKVNPQCDCQHNTAGVNCERCAELYNDLPWRPAEEEDTHTCQRCECNNHAQRCHFDQTVYEASGRKSGGVCEGCLHHTMGPKCDQCVPGYQPNPLSRMDRPDACIRCVCNAEGSVNGGQCDENSDTCKCKANVEGQRCDRCKRGYYGLSASNPLGCSRCSCSEDGSLSDTCDPLTGQCVCRPHFHGRACDACAKGYWKPSSTGRCELCSCDPTRSYSDTCDQATGQCSCRPGFGGRRCTDCPANAYGNPIVGCQPCRCNAEGTLPGMCDKKTGACLCRPGVTGTRCDSCSKDHCNSFPACESCPSCYFTLHAQRRNITLALEKFTPGFPFPPGGTGDPANFGPRIRALEATLNQIKDSLTLPPGSAKQIDDALAELDKLRDELDKINENLPSLTKTPGLDSELDKLKALLDRLSVEYRDKKAAIEKTISPDSLGAFNVIKNAYDQSKDAAKKVEDTKEPLEESADNRDETKDLYNKVQPANTKDLDKLNQNMGTKPNLTPVAKEVCGSTRTEPCTPLKCEGEDLCPPEGAPPCKKGEKCVGALPLGKKADADADNVKDKLDTLTEKITDATEKLQDAQEKTNQVRETAEKLSNGMKKARDDIEGDLQETREVVKELKDFLADPTSNLTHIKEVSDWILKAKLPLSLNDLKKKLDELKKLADNLPDSTAVLKDAQPQLDTAKKLLDDAKKARDKALGVKGEVDDILSGLGSVETTMTDVEEKLQDSLDTIDDLKDNLTKAQDQMTPAEETLDDITDVTKPLKPQLDELKKLLDKARKAAEDAQDTADEAEKEANDGKEDLVPLEEQLKRLKDKVPPTPPGGGGDSGPVGDRLTKLKEDAGNLTDTTNNMLKDLEGKADSLKKLQDEIVEKSTKLNGLDTELKELLADLRKKASDLRTCQG